MKAFSSSAVNFDGRFESALSPPCIPLSPRILSPLHASSVKSSWFCHEPTGEAEERMKQREDEAHIGLKQVAMVLVQMITVFL
jgi:hypothetical protein